MYTHASDGLHVFVSVSSARDFQMGRDQLLKLCCRRDAGACALCRTFGGFPCAQDCSRLWVCRPAGSRLDPHLPRAHALPSLQLPPRCPASGLCPCSFLCLECSSLPSSCLSYQLGSETSGRILSFVALIITSSVNFDRLFHLLVCMCVCVCVFVSTAPSTTLCT